MNSYNARMLANIVKWIRDNRKDVPFVYDGVNYTLTIRMESIFIERNNEINQGVYLEDRKFNWPDGLLEVIWKEIEKIRLNEIATKFVVSIDNKNYRIFLLYGYVVCKPINEGMSRTFGLSEMKFDFIEKVYRSINPSTENKNEKLELISERFLYKIYNALVENKPTFTDNQDEVKMDYRKLLLNDLSQHMEDFNVLLDNKKFLTNDTEKHVAWALQYIQETFNGIRDNKIIPKSQMQKVKEYLQDKEHVIKEVEIIKYISSKLSTFKANEYPNLDNVIELILGAGYHVYGDLTQTFVKVKEFFERDRYKELYEILKG